MTTHRFEGHLDVDVRLLAGSLTVHSGPDGQASVELSADTSAGEALIEDSRVELEPRQGAARLVVHVPRDRGRRGWLTLRDPSVQIALTIPAGSDLQVRTAAARVLAPLRLGRAELEAASGDLSLGEVDELRVSSASGDVEARHVNGPASLKTASGDVRLGEVGGDLDVRTASGDVRVTAVGGDLDVRSVSGDVSVGGVAGAEATVNATSGDVTLAIEPGRGIHLDVSTVSGALSSELDDDDGSGGVDLRLRVRTVSGNVHLRRAGRTAASSG